MPHFCNNAKTLELTLFIEILYKITIAINLEDWRNRFIYSGAAGYIINFLKK